MFNHIPVFNVDAVCEKYTLDGVPPVYVCTSEINKNNLPCDVFYYHKPHPVYGNRYFYLVVRDGKSYIGNADSIESETFACIQDGDGAWNYSMYRHHMNTIDSGDSIDGGRTYIKVSGTPILKIFVVRDGKLIYTDQH
jgi:hypothetical protein